MRTCAVLSFSRFRRGCPIPSPRCIVRFGVFEVDVKAGEVRKHGRRLRVQEKPFHVLQALVEHPGEVVSREELRARLWPADTFVDFDNGLNNAVNKVRAALGDSATVPKYVETVGRRGYRFIAAVEDETVEPRPAIAALALRSAPTGLAQQAPSSGWFPPFARRRCRQSPCCRWPTSPTTPNRSIFPMA